MDIELHEIKYLRKQLGLTQKQLADKANVSQSLIAKIESGTIEPTYSKARNILAVVQQLSIKKECIARDIMSTKIILAQESDDIGSIAKTMRKQDISQVPVVRHKTPIGVVTETLLIEKMLSGKDPKEVAGTKAKDIMAECPPIISPDTKQTALVGLLKHFPVLLVAEKGEILGLVTKADVLGLIKK